MGFLFCNLIDTAGFSTYAASFCKWFADLGGIMEFPLLVVIALIACVCAYYAGRGANDELMSGFASGSGLAFPQPALNVLIYLGPHQVRHVDVEQVDVLDRDGQEADARYLRRDHNPARTVELFLFSPIVPAPSEHVELWLRSVGLTLAGLDELAAIPALPHFGGQRFAIRALEGRYFYRLGDHGGRPMLRSEGVGIGTTCAGWMLACTYRGDRLPREQLRPGKN